jgi:hypothetical protein
LFLIVAHWSFITKRTSCLLFLVSKIFKHLGKEVAT